MSIEFRIDDHWMSPRTAIAYIRMCGHDEKFIFGILEIIRHDYIKAFNMWVDNRKVAHRISWFCFYGVSTRIQKKDQVIEFIPIPGTQICKIKSSGSIENEAENGFWIWDERFNLAVPQSED